MPTPDATAAAPPGAAGRAGDPAGEAGGSDADAPGPARDAGAGERAGALPVDPVDPVDPADGVVQPDGPCPAPRDAAAGASLWNSAARPAHVPAALALAAVALLAGLLLPVMEIETLVFWQDSYSILVGTLALLGEGHLLLGCALLLFSVLFPAAKLLALGLLWFRDLDEDLRERALWWTAALGKWSMLDVFVVAVTLVLTTATSLASARPRAGLYAFGAAVLLSMLLSLELDHVNERARRRRVGGPER